MRLIESTITSANSKIWCNIFQFIVIHISVVVFLVKEKTVTQIKTFIPHTKEKSNVFSVQRYGIVIARELITAQSNVNIKKKNIL